MKGTIISGKEISEETNRKIRYLASKIGSDGIKGVSESVPTFCSMTIYFDPFVISRKKLEKKILKVIDSYKESSGEKRRVFLITVC